MKFMNLKLFETQFEKSRYVVRKGLGHSTDCGVREYFPFPFCKLLYTYLVIFVLQRPRNLFRKKGVLQKLGFIRAV